MADGQGTIGSQILKPNIKKLRRMGKGSVIGGFAGQCLLTQLSFKHTNCHQDQVPCLLFQEAGGLHLLSEIRSISCLAMNGLVL